VTVGETLTEARYQAGLSVEELSERTRIRGTVIRSIEQDDYQACGGDLFVRGYVRAIAGAVGIDAQPLIREYDLGRAGSSNERANGSADRYAKGSSSRSAPDTAPTAFDLPAVTEPPPRHDDLPYQGDLNATRFDLPTVRQDPAATAFDLPRVPEVPAVTGSPAVVPAAAAQPPGTTETRYDLAPVPDDLMAAGYDLQPTAEPAEADSATKIIPALGPDAAGPRATSAWPATGEAVSGHASTGEAGTGQDGAVRIRTARGKRRGLFIAAAAVVLVAAGAALGVQFATGSTVIRNTAATSVPSATAPSAAKANAAARASAAAKASASAEASASAARASAAAEAKASQAARAKTEAERVTELPIASVMAYGPDGLADGDVPGDAKNVIARDPAQPWATQWYATPTFGMLKHGTGLLLDLGGRDTVTSVRLGLAPHQGTDLQIRVGNGTASQDLRVAATAKNVGGTVNITLPHPVAARYLLIWFTQLPPDGSGHYQESVSHVSVTGHR